MQMGLLSLLEFAIRTTLGARRTRIVLQLFTESMVFSLAAGMLAVGVAAAAARGLLAMLPRVAILPRLDSVKVDFGMLVFTGALTLLVSLVFRFIPLLRISWKREYDALKNEGRVFSARSKRRLRQLFVVSEFVLSLVWLILGVLLTRSFVKLQHTSPGFDANNLLTFRVIAPEVNYGRFTWGEKDPRREKLYEKIEQVLTEVPGVESVALAANLPLAQNFNASPVLVTGQAPQPKATRPNFSEEESTGTQMVNPQYFHTLGVKLVSGRFFEERDREGASNVAIVNEAFARKFLSNEDPVGEVTVWFAKTIIVGVVADFKIISLDRNPLPEIFWCLRQVSPPNVWILRGENRIRLRSEKPCAGKFKVWTPICRSRRCSPCRT
jgi:putative ABC transport system permease protein